MTGQNPIEKLPGALLPWYEKYHRILPWRYDTDPYHIWVSEIMLQQTRVEAVKGYYTRFIQTLPTIADLANCDDDLLHKLWEGLGYYSRVRNLKKAAGIIMSEHCGIFPGEYGKLLTLPGVGEYTAGAICSIAYNQPTPAVDGNVLRIISRITDDNTPIDLPAYKKQVRDSLKGIYPRQAGAFTQALMELGATLCGPNRKPDCGNCPCKTFCLGCLRSTAQQLPVRLPKRQRKTEKHTVFIFCSEGKYALQKRPNGGLLADLWQFPNMPGKWDTQKILKQVEGFGLKPTEILLKVERKHVFTHIEWDMCGAYIEILEPAGDFVWFTEEEIQTRIALPTAFRLFWDGKEREIFQKKKNSI